MYRLILALTVATLSLSSHADELLIDAITNAPSNSSAGLPRPQHGDKLRQVEARFGSPESVHGPVGNPPILRWDYPGYSVYFEYDTVLTSVVHHRQPPRQP